MKTREETLAELVSEILEWTRYKNTDWALRAKEALSNTDISEYERGYDEGHAVGYSDGFQDGVKHEENK